MSEPASVCAGLFCEGMTTLVVELIAAFVITGAVSVLFVMVTAVSFMTNSSAPSTTSGRVSVALTVGSADWIVTVLPEARRMVSDDSSDKLP